MCIPSSYLLSLDRNPPSILGEGGGAPEEDPSMIPEIKDLEFVQGTLEIDVAEDRRSFRRG